MAWLSTVAIRHVWADIWRKRVLPVDPSRLCVPAGAGDDALSRAVVEAFALDLSEHDRSLLEMRYERNMTDAAIAAELLAPDERTVAARGQALRLKRLEAEDRLARSLAARGYEEFSLDVRGNGDYSNASRPPSD